MIKRITTFAVVVFALGSLIGVSSTSAQTRRVMIEEFTGSWCGWCPRGIVAIQQLEENSPGKVVPVAIHIGSSVPDPMENLQGDTLAGGISTLSSQTSVTGFPSGWTARTLTNGTWLSDPMNWHDSINSTGVVDQMITDPAQANVTVDNVTFDPSTHMISARVNVTFVGGMTGDVRMNVYATEDSVTGGSEYNQTNYYYQNTQYPESPFYNRGTGPVGDGSIANFYHMHVFRGAATTVWGAKGIIPSTVQGGASYSQVFTFPLPSTVQDPNHVHLVGFVHQYSTTDASKNEILDAAEVPLSQAPISIVKASYDISPQDGSYLTAKANGDLNETLIVTNTGTETGTINLSVDPSSLPTGWSASLSPASVTVDANKSQNVTLKITAPEQSAFVSLNINSAPFKEGAYGATNSTTVYALSDNTKYGFYNFSGSADAAAYSAIPDTMKTHTAIIPLSNDVIASYDPTNFNVVMLTGDPMLDNDGYYNVPPMISTITDLLSAGKKVFVTTNDAMYWAISDQSNTGHTSTDAVNTFFNDQLGITYRTYFNRIVNNQYSTFKVIGTSDPIGTGINATANASGALAGADASVTFDLNPDSKSVPLFYFDSKAVNNGGLRYTSPEGGKIVFLNFQLNSLADQSAASTIAARTYTWLLSDDAAGVTAPIADNTSMSASPNPFQGSTEIRYTAANGEHNVSFVAVDLLGREVAQLSSHSSQGNTFVADFNASNLAAGTYTIVAHSSTGSHQVRVVSK